METLTLEKNPLNLSNRIHETLTIAKPKKIKQLREQFTKKQIELLYDISLTATELSILFNKNVGCIYQKRNALSIKTGKTNSETQYYTKEQEELLRDPKNKSRDLAKQFNKSPNAIYRKRNKLNIQIKENSISKSKIISKNSIKSKLVNVSNIIETSKQIIQRQIELNINGIFIYIPNDTKSIVITGNNYNITR